MDYFQRMIRSEVLTLSPYTLETQPEPKGAARLSANENGFGTPPAVMDALVSALGETDAAARAISRYPDSTCSALREALSRKHGLPADWFLTGNGLDDVINVLALAVLDKEDEVIVPAATFGVYAAVTGMMGARLVTVPMRDDLSIDTEAIAKAVNNRTSLIFLCNPNNPTGSSTSRGELEALLGFLDSLPTQPLLVIDQAYEDFADDETDFPEGTGYIHGRRYIVVLRTFSKIRGLAGLRVGYAAAHPGLLSYLYRVRQPYTVNAFAQVAALASLEEESAREFARAARGAILRERARLEAFLGERSVAYVPSQGNFVFAFFDKTPDELRSLSKNLAGEKILTRTLIHDKAPSGLRFSIGTPEENARLIEALCAILPEKPKEL